MADGINIQGRYSRQQLFYGIGSDGQKKLEQSRVVIVGCGALGCNIANLLVRAGVGKVRIIDRDFVEYHNLHRQTLFDEEDVKNRIPKAVAAMRRLQKVNSMVEIEGIDVELNPVNAESLCEGSDVILDGLDNLKARYLLNDVALKYRIPYVYGGVIASFGMTMTIIPGVSPCFRCIFPDMPPPRTIPSCETDGVLGPATTAISSLEASEALKILTGANEINRELITFDVWDISFERYPIVRKNDCPACNGEYDFLDKFKGKV